MWSTPARLRPLGTFFFRVDIPGATPPPPLPPLVHFQAKGVRDTIAIDALAHYYAVSSIVPSWWAACGPCQKMETMTTTKTAGDIGNGDDNKILTTVFLSVFPSSIQPVSIRN